MNNYKLYIQKSGTWSIVDLGDDKPAMNYQVNDIAELKDRQCDYSQALKLPLSKRNCALFDIPENMDVVTDIPYIKIPCRLFSNESALAGTGSVLILDRVTTYIEVAIISGNSDLFELLQQPMTSVDLGSIIRNEASFTPDSYGNYADATYTFAFATYINSGKDGLDMDYRRCQPFVFLKKAIENLLSQNGYSLETNLLDAQWNRKAISISSLKTSDGSLDMFNGTAIGGLDTQDHETDLSTDQFISMVTTGYGESSMYGGVDFIAPCACSIKVKVDIVSHNFIHGLNLKVKTSAPETLFDYTINSTPATYAYQLEKVFNLEAGQILNVAVFKFSESGQGDITVNFQFSEMVSTTVPIGGRLYFAPNLGFTTQLDFFKMFVQLFGITISVDNDTKVVKAYTMQNLYDNKTAVDLNNNPIAKDWSNKLHSDSNEINFSLPSFAYAQTNYIRFDDNAIDDITDLGFFSISNNTLELNKDLFTIKLEAGLDRSQNSQEWNPSFGDPIILRDVANIPLAELKGTEIVFKAGKPHIVDISLDALPIQMGEIDNNFHFATHVKAQTFIDTFYPGLISMLTSAKYAELLFFLTDQDIEDFNQEIPVYIQKYGHYFYVNKIVNYISGQLTKCQIIKL